MFKNKKIMFYLVILLIIIYLIISFVISIPRKSKLTNTVFLGSKTKVTVNNDIISTYNKDIDIPKLGVKIFFKNKFIDGYIITSLDSSDLSYYYGPYSDDGNKIILEDSLIAHTPDISIKIMKKNDNIGHSLDEVYNYAKQNNITLSKDIILDYLFISNLDIDNDDKEEYIYSVGLIKDAENYDTFVFLKKEDKYILIDADEGKYDEMPNIILRFFNLIDFNNDENYEFVIEKITGEYGQAYFELYNFDGNSFTKIEEE